MTRMDTSNPNTIKIPTYTKNSELAAALRMLAMMGHANEALMKAGRRAECTVISPIASYALSRAAELIETLPDGASMSWWVATPDAKTETTDWQRETVTGTGTASEVAAAATKKSKKSK